METKRARPHVICFIAAILVATALQGHAGAAEPGLAPPDVFDCVFGAGVQPDPESCFTSVPARDRISPPEGGSESEPDVRCLVAGFDDRCESDEARVGEGIDYQYFHALTPDQDTVFLGGYQDHGGFAFGAYDAETGRRHWLNRPDLPGRAWVSRIELEGETLVGFGSVRGHGRGSDVLAFAMDADTGRLLWKLVDDGDRHDDYASDVVFAPDGTTLYVIGSTEAWETSHDALVLEVDLASGEVTDRVLVGSRRKEAGIKGLVTAKGDALMLLGYARGGSFVTSLSLSGLRPRWTQRLQSDADGRPDLVHLIDDDPSGELIFLGGYSNGADGPGTAVYALEANSGSVRWIQRHVSGGYYSELLDLEVDPAGRRVFVTGSAEDSDADVAYNYGDIYTAAFDAGTGEDLWKSMHGAPASSWEFGQALATSDRGNRVYVLGYSSQQYVASVVTLGYDGSSGEQLWAARYDDAAQLGYSWPMDVLVGPTGKRVHAVVGAGPAASILSYEP